MVKLDCIPKISCLWNSKFSWTSPLIVFVSPTNPSGEGYLSFQHMSLSWNTSSASVVHVFWFFESMFISLMAAMAWMFEILASYIKIQVLSSNLTSVWWFAFKKSLCTTCGTSISFPRQLFFFSFKPYVNHQQPCETTTLIDAGHCNREP